MVAVPLVIPDTTPDAETEATDASLVAHVPPLTLSVKVADEPVQMIGVPLIALARAAGFTVTVVVATAVPQVLVTK